MDRVVRNFQGAEIAYRGGSIWHIQHVESFPCRQQVVYHIPEECGQLRGKTRVSCKGPNQLPIHSRVLHLDSTWYELLGSIINISVGDKKFQKGLVPHGSVNCTDAQQALVLDLPNDGEEGVRVVWRSPRIW